MLAYVVTSRKLKEGVFEMTCTLMIDDNMLKVARGYKYVVYSPKMVREDDCFEYLHSFVGWSDRDPNRALKIDHSHLESMFTG